jgi:Ca2+-binding EF-hand superfamily protein
MDQGGPGRGFMPFGGPDGGDRLQNFLRQLDADGDGRIEENEVEGRRRFLVESMARRAGIEANFPISVRRLQDALANPSGPGGSSSTTAEGATPNKPAVEPLVPGFGIELDLPPVLKFGERPDTKAGVPTRAAALARARSRTSSSAGSRTSSSAGSPRGGQNDGRMAGWSRMLMRRADENGDGKLQRNEWNDEWGDFRAADRNRDGTVNPDELAQQLSASARGGPGNERSGSDAPPSSNGTGSGSGNPPPRKPYRLPTPTELLPKDLPDWFARKDINADGQVAMAEFESPGSWNAAAVAQFMRYDLNNDGLITPQECLKALGQPQVEQQVARAQTGAPAVAANGPGPPPGPPPGPRISGQDRRTSRGPERGSRAPPASGTGLGDPWVGF